MTLLRVDGAAPRMSKIPEEYIRNTQQASSNTYDLAKINEVHSLGIFWQNGNFIAKMGN